MRHILSTEEEIENFRESIVERLSPRISELLQCSYLGLPTHHKGRMLTKAVNEIVGDREASRRIINRLVDCSKELVRGITLATHKQLIVQGQQRLLESICAAFELATIPDWLLSPDSLVPRRMAAAIRRSVPKHILDTDEEVETYLFLLARLFTEVVHAMPKFERDEARASALKLHHFIPDVEHIVETAVAVETRPEEEADYCHALLRHHDYVELFGADIALESRRHSLSVAYVSLSLSQPKNDSEEYLRPMPLETLLETLQPYQNRMLIRGHAGSGKSTLFRWIVLQAIRGIPPALGASQLQVRPDETKKDNWRARIPILIRLRDYPDGKLLGPNDIITVISTGPGNPSVQWVDSILTAGRAIMLFDGIDEIPHRQREAVRANLEEIIQAFPHNCYLLSTRPEAVSRRWLDTLGFREAYVNPLSDPDKIEFIEKWHKAVGAELQGQGRSDAGLNELCSELIARLPENPAVNRLAYSPLLCAMICALHRDRNKRLPQSQSDLCESLCQMLLERREIESGLNLSGFPSCYVRLGYVQKRAIVQELAHYLVRNGVSAVEFETAAERVEVVLSRFGKTSENSPHEASDLLKVLVERSGMLREQRPGVIDFVHNTLKEYLAAERFVQDQDYGQLALNCMDSAWAPVLLFAVAHPSGRFATKLIASVLRPPPRSKDAPSESEETTRARKLMVLRLRTAAAELEPSMHEQVTQLTQDLFPPRTVESAEAYAGIGNIAVSFLRYRDSLSVSESTACVRTLRLIGTPDARVALAAYASDSRPEVVCELVQAINAFEIPLVQSLLLEGKMLPMEISTQIVSLDGIGKIRDAKALDLTGVRAKDFRPLSELVKLQSLRLKNVSISLQDINRLSALESLEIFHSEVRGLDAVEHMSRLNTLSIVDSCIEDLELIRSPSVTSLNLSKSTWKSEDDFVEGLPALQALDLSGTKFYDLSCLRSLEKLASLNIADTTVGSVSELNCLDALLGLDISGTDVDERDLDTLITSLPRMNITRAAPRMLSIDEVASQISIVIVTVRNDEFLAVCSAFHAKASVTGGQNLYRFGVVDTPDGSVGVAICRCSEEGNAKAQTVTGHALDDFRSAPPLWVLLVGIAGGFPDNEFSLGDVIVANRLHDFSVTAELERGRKENYGRGAPMDRDVETLLGWLPTLQENTDWSREKTLSRARPHEPAEEKPRRKDYYGPNYYGPKEWKTRVRDSLIAQSGRKFPKLWIAPNVSGNTLLKSTALARQWKLCARSAASVEMELSGAYEAVHARRHVSRLLSIRGISDVVGYKRSADWLTYACRTSASVAFALVRCGILHRIVAAQKSGRNERH